MTKAQFNKQIKEFVKYNFADSKIDLIYKLLTTCQDIITNDDTIDVNLTKEHFTIKNYSEDKENYFTIENQELIKLIMLEYFKESKTLYNSDDNEYDFLTDLINYLKNKNNDPFDYVEYLNNQMEDIKAICNFEFEFIDWFE